MNHFKRSQIGGVVSALLLCVSWPACAQDNATTNSSTSSNTSGPVLGPPALKDFQLEPRERLVTQPPPQPQRPSNSPPQQQQPQAAPEPQRPPTNAVDRRPVDARPTRPAAPVEPTPVPGGEVIPPIVAGPEAAPSLETPIAPVPDTPPQTPPEENSQGSNWWLYIVPLAGLLLVGMAFFRRRRSLEEEAGEPEHNLLAANASSAPAAAPAIRAERAPRPWLELELRAQRASFTDTEWVVQFELSVANTGQHAARNVKIDVMLFNAGKEQDKEIGAFFRTAGRDSTKLALPTLDAGRTGIIDGEVAMRLAEMRAMKLNNQTLFIPVVAVNSLYEWGEDGNTGQTAKSYIVGRELQEPSEKMGAFRLDLGPRIWRTVGQRPHKLARRF